MQHIPVGLVFACGIDGQDSEEGRRQRAEGLLLQCKRLPLGEALRTDLH
ncbi:MAG: hypothetical protein RMZ43_006195 [Nostoc sp. CmiVER01]|nr:hypothetical protein [Nostoc sp. CmiVER01]MDZ8125501.1 hypothetical protein [Nostoc sp. CmiVER01]